MLRRDSRPSRCGRREGSRDRGASRLPVLTLLAVAALGAAGYFLLPRSADDGDSTTASDTTADSERPDRPRESAAGSSALLDPAGAREFVARFGPTSAERPNDAALHFRLGVALSTLGRGEDAIRHFREVVRIRPDDPQGYLSLGNALALESRFDEAVPHLRKATVLAPGLAKAHNNLAVALKNTGKLDEAYAHIHEAQRLKRVEDVVERGSIPPVRTATLPGEGEVARLSTQRLRSREAADETMLDPHEDGWESEDVAEQARILLERMADLLTEGDTVDPDDLGEIASVDVSVGALRPSPLADAFRDKSIVVRRRRAEPPGKRPIASRGRQGLAESLTRLARPFASASDADVHVKVVRVRLAGATVKTTAYFEAESRGASVTLQQHATWSCRWTRGEGGQLQLTSIEASDYEEVEARGPRWLADCTTSVLDRNLSFRKQLVPGLNHWLARIERVHNMHIFARYGLAIGDVNGDGLDDVYVCQPGGLPNRLYVQLSDGTCDDVSARAGVDWLDHTSSALWLDLDNDGDQDLVAATFPGLVVMENDSTGKLERRAVLPTNDIDVHSISAADYDNDGDLDLYVCVDFADRASARTGAADTFVYHDANDGGANVLYRNDLTSNDLGRDWRFTVVTREVGLDRDNRRHSLASSWEDYDNDGDLDLYVANDYGQNCLYRNDGGHFVNVASAAGVVDFGSGMSASWGDYNRDGWMDLYVGNMFSSAGSRITRQDRFKREEGETTRALYRRFAKGNSLFKNRGGGSFEEVGAQEAVEMGRWAWSSIFADLNNDGWEDLLVANGYITTEDTGDL